MPSEALVQAPRLQGFSGSGTVCQSLVNFLALAYIFANTSRNFRGHCLPSDDFMVGKLSRNALLHRQLDGFEQSDEFQGRLCRVLADKFNLRSQTKTDHSSKMINKITCTKIWLLILD